MLKITLPAGTPVPVVGVTAAVNVTLLPVTAGFAFAFKVVAVGVVTATLPKVNSDTKPVVKFLELNPVS